MNSILRKSAPWLVLLWATCVVASAQSTSVTFQVTDTDGELWFNGTWTVQLTNPNGQPGQFNVIGTNVVVPNQQQSGTMTSLANGSLTVTPNTSIAPGGSQWTFNFCPLATPAQCLQQSYVITGTSQALTVTPPGPRVSVNNPLVRAVAYLDLEITGASLGSQYFNLTDTTIHLCVAINSGNCTWVSVAGSGGGFVAGGDLSGTATLQQVKGILSNPLPALATGYLNWNGTTWGFNTPTGSILGLTTGWIPQATSATTIGNSNPQLDNGVTTSSTLTYKGNAISIPSDGTHSAALELVGNTTLPILPSSNAFGWLGPNSASFTSYFFQPNATPPTVGQVLTAGTPGTCTGSSATCIPLNYAASSGVSGSGTANTLALWTGTSALGNSLLTAVTSPNGLNYNLGSSLFWQLDTSHLSWNSGITGSANVVIANTYNAGGGNTAGGIEIQGAPTSGSACAGPAIVQGGQNGSFTVATVVVNGGCANGFGAIGGSIVMTSGVQTGGNGNGVVELNDNVGTFIQESGNGVESGLINAQSGFEQNGTALGIACGTTTTCSHTATPLAHFVFGTVALSSASPSTAVVTGISPSFTSTSTYNCTVTNETTASDGLKVANTSSSSITITGPNTVTDTVSYICIGT